MSKAAHDFDRHFDADVYDREYFEGSGTKSGYTDYTTTFEMVQMQNAIIHDVMRSRLTKTLHEHQNGYRSLDVGCAYGHGVQYWAGQGFQASGFDISDWAIGKAKELYDGQAQFRVGSAMEEFDYWTMREYGHTQRPNAPKFDIITANELFEHIESHQAIDVLLNMQKHGKWGAFCINGRTNPFIPEDASHGDHGHLNNHYMQWWTELIGKFGILDFDAMFEMSKASYEYNPDVHWHNRYVVVQFKDMDV